MQRTLPAALALLVAACTSTLPEPPIALAIHGGAGTILPESLTPELEAEYRVTLEAALAKVPDDPNARTIAAAYKKWLLSLQGAKPAGRQASRE